MNNARTTRYYKAMPSAFARTSNPITGVRKLGIMAVGLALALSTATQLRPEEGVGPGELLLLVISIMMIFGMILRPTVRRKYLRVLAPYLAVLFVIFGLSLVGVLLSPEQQTTSLSWLRQYLFVGAAAAIPFVIVLYLGPSQTYKALWWYSLFIVSVLSSLVLFWYVGGQSGSLVGIDLGGSRFVGWTENPNQLALAVAGVPFIVALLIEKGERTMWAGLPVFVGALVVGWATASNALMVGWALGLGFIMASQASRRWDANDLAFRGRGSRRLRSRGKKTWIVLGLIFGAGALWLIVRHWNALFEGVIRGGAQGQGSIRLELWRTGLEAWMESPIFGHGPGHYSGIGAPFMGMEAHNLYVDWLASYGILGLLVIGGLFLSGVAIAFKRRNFAVLGLVLTLSIISMFHFYARHPIFWMLMLIPFLLQISLPSRR